MPRTTSIAVLRGLVAISLTTLPAARAGETVAVEGIPFPCAWKNKPQESSVSPHTVSITAMKGTDLYNSPSDGARQGNAPMLLFEPEGDFVLTADLAVEFGTEYDGGSLVVYVGEDHWAKYLFELSHYGQFVVTSGVTQGATDDAVHAVIRSDRVSLRLARSGAMFILYVSEDGKSWQYQRATRFASDGRIKVGFSAQAPLSERCTATFSNITYKPGAFEDYWTGE